MKALRLGLILLGIGIGTVLLLAAGLWGWVGSDGSLATVLAQAQKRLPSGHTLQVKDVRGTLRHGGHIGWLRWSKPGLSLQASGIDLTWTLAPLLQRHLQLTRVQVAELVVEDTANSADPMQAPVPEQWRWPVTVTAPFSLTSIRYAGTTQLLLTQVTGNYTFDSVEHRIYQGTGHISSGNYEFSGQLALQSPMALAVQVQGRVDTTLPPSRQRLTVAAQAQLVGTLAGPDAALTLQATLQPELPAARTKRSPAMQASLSAQIRPWQAQPLMQLSAHWQALNLAPLWPSAPQTQLTGTLSVLPLNAGWQGQLSFSNTFTGPLNQQRLPLRSLLATVEHAQGQWGVTALQAELAVGRVSGSGQFKEGRWRGALELLQLDPAAIDQRFASLPLNGRVQAQQASDGIDFSAQLQAAPGQGRSKHSTLRAPGLAALRLQGLTLQGVWAAPLLKLSAIQVDTDDGQLQGQLSYQHLTQAMQGQLALTLPGLNGSVNGHLAADDGKGWLDVSITDAALATPWLMRWPTLAQALPQTRLTGAADLKLAWQGGWQRQGRSLSVAATLRARQLGLRGAAPMSGKPPDAWQLEHLQADLSGTLAQLALRSQGSLLAGKQLIDWQAQASAAQVDADHWQGWLQQLKIGLRNGTSTTQWWLQTDAADANAVTLDWQQTGSGHKLLIGPGTAQITGALGSGVDAARLSWTASSWSRLTSATAVTAAPAQWHSQGQLSGLPLSWLDAWGFTTLSELGIGSTLILNGAWEVAQSERFKLNLTLSRASGDLSFHAGTNGPLLAQAGVGEASARVQLQDGQLEAGLLWRSERAGQAQFALRTQLQPGRSGWDWPPDAPLQGTLNLQGPPIALWSTLAPPGWRLSGTVDAVATLSGTRAQPQWHGTLQGNELVVRSVVDGIDLQRGKLTAKLDGQQLRIEDFTLWGAGSDETTQSGKLSLTGTASWIGLEPADANWASGLQLAMQAQAKGLRLSSRSDRRIVVSGTLNAELKASRLSLRGALSADQALILLPNESAPALGDDVVLRPSRTASATAVAPAGVASVAVAQPRRRQVSVDAKINLDLGPDFQLRGRGLDTRLAGQLELHATGTAAPALSGTLRTVRGTYQAYGQRLAIEQGILHFSGPLDNPALDILAIRANLPQKVGVQVSGSALSPLVRLYADPELPEAQKLAWLVMGRAASASGGEAALLQQAALSLLGGQRAGPSASLTQALGLDELSFSGNPGDSASAATIKLGKRFANDFYLAYESGLSGSMGVLAIFYDLSDSLTLRARTGEQSAIDLIWTRRFD